MIEESGPEFWQGVEQFNQQQFYACHDTLEALWMEAVEPQRSFYQGILQISVALYHLGNQNRRGAIILLGEGMNRLRHYQPTFAGIDVAQLLQRSRDLQAKLQAQTEQPNELLHQQQEEPFLVNLPTIERVASEP